MVGGSEHDLELLEEVRRAAATMGLTGPAVALAEDPPGAGLALDTWLAAGHHGEMSYMARLGRRRADPRSWATWSRRVALFAQGYNHGSPCATTPSRAAISRYARGRDYHEVLKERLSRLIPIFEKAGYRALPFVDSSPLMEKALAAAGGLGWIGKNGNLLLPGAGSFFFLGGLATDAEWPLDSPVEDECGPCSLCITACPTAAIIAPGIIDARRCISYLTIELKGAIPLDLRPLMGNRVFGCDDCQDVCPLNAPPQPAGDTAYCGDQTHTDLLDLAALDAESFRRRYRHTPVWRTRWRGLLRNVMVALGNWGSPTARDALAGGLEHAEPLVREHAAWGLGRIGDTASRALLTRRLPVETHAAVREEIRRCLAEPVLP
ncbi:MAG: tRNA epoxyqueuosine(34) reductase QueG [Acidobacteria bacterium]|nr:tRNA epoxyqueuosine(34) reductase QueG [Acidobacteriota bacterium]